MVLYDCSASCSYIYYLRVLNGRSGSIVRAAVCLLASTNQLFNVLHLQQHLYNGNTTLNTTLNTTQHNTTLNTTQCKKPHIIHHTLKPNLYNVTLQLNTLISTQHNTKNLKLYTQT